ncbi:type I-B CRISPR-associated protein Cas7/Cst2/DevR [Streptomonospora sp. S1-112]|uniref:Type I-B CRISPR-associated protein Cas7/Cst2/DevR n=1 Tax=Streptomonospora mangrovi TaxID=2883123 RepID=A0A9X3SDT5_9ACTN|nr:type I-B CRISPR-associated protein Cas7/Cst2/DevR [Streptomonospora mangrovi]MDA0565213.1 type I-B CRISPR-associated protein Cas7/Cst2/DevR [Streptomonospora mangrovi]
MSYLAGKIVLAVTAGAPNNAKGENTTTPVKQARVRNKTYPYVSAQAFRRWIRDTMTDAGAVPSPIERAGANKAQKATTAADPVRYADDDLFGYMRTGARKKDEEATTLRDSPFMTGTLMAVEPARPTEDFGVMSRGGNDPVLHSHQFYTADLAAPFVLDVARVGTFTLGRAGGKANYLSQEAALQAAAAVEAGAQLVEFRGQQALRLPIQMRRERVAVLLEAIADLVGGAKKALHYGDRTPALLALVAMTGGANPLGFVIDGAQDGSGLRVRAAALREELRAWEGNWEAPVRLGWRPGFHDAARTAFEAEAEDLMKAGTVRIDHPRTVLRGLAAEVRAGDVDHWFEDPQR